MEIATKAKEDLEKVTKWKKEVEDERDRQEYMKKQIDKYAE